MKEILEGEQVKTLIKLGIIKEHQEAVSFLDLYNILPGAINGYSLLITKAAITKKAMVNYYSDGKFLIDEFIEEDEPIDALYKLLLVLNKKKYI